MKQLNKRIFEAGPFVLYAVCALVLWLRFYFYQLNPDAVSMARIAELYAQGSFAQAVNAYWGPLLSWMAAPLVWLGVPAYAALKAWIIAFGAGVVWQAKKMSATVGLGAPYNTLSVYGIAVFVLYAVFSATTADVPLVCLALIYLNQCDSCPRGSTWMQSVTLGAIMALCYFAKAYALPLVVLHYSLHSFFAGTRWGSYARTMAAFSFFVIPWVTIISLNSGFLTYGTSGRYTHKVYGPQSQGHVFTTAGLVELPHTGAQSPWYDPLVLPENPQWNPLTSKSDFVFLTKKIKTNISKTVDIFSEWNALIPLALCLCFLLLSTGRFKGIPMSWWLFIMSYPLGYWCIYIESRYLWPIYVPIVLISTLALVRITARSVTASLVVVALFIFYTVKPAVTKIIDERQPNKFTYTQAQELKKYMQPLCPQHRCRFAAYDEFESAQLLAYHLNGQLLGLVSVADQDQLKPQEVFDDLAQSKIDGVFIFKKLAQLPQAAPRGWKEISPLTFGDFRLFVRSEP